MIRVESSLETTLAAVADYIGFTSIAKEYLVKFANEDPHTGWDGGAGEWPCGSLWTPEGKTLYALIQALWVTEALEIGALFGCSSTHIAEALLKTGGHLTSVDITENAGALTREHVKPVIMRVVSWGDTYVKTLADNSQTFIYEDTDHSVRVTRDIWAAAQPKLKSGGVMISHDPFHPTSGQDVIDGVVQALGHDNFLMVLVPPSDCGLLVYVKP